MAQLSWLYADDTGSQYNIGLYHGAESGHVMIYCNRSILLVDFSIKKETKNYSFYIGEEFFELGLNRGESNQYSYELKINKEISTPLNLVRNKVNKYYNYVCFGLGAAFIFAIAFTTYLLYVYQY